MGLGKTIKKAVQKPIKDVKKGMDKSFKKGITSLVKVFKKIVIPLMAALNKVLKFMKFIGDILKNVLKKITDFALSIYAYIRCVIRIISNFQKCVIFYILDVIKYLILYFPLLIVQIVMILCKMKIPNMKDLKKIIYQLDKLLSWPASIQYDCFTCKKVKETPRRMKLVNTLMNGAENFFKKSNINFHFITILLFSLSLFILIVNYLVSFIITSNRIKKEVPLNPAS
jgi:hypothetical protein